MSVATHTSVAGPPTAVALGDLIAVDNLSLFDIWLGHMGRDMVLRILDADRLETLTHGAPDTRSWGRADRPD